MIIQRYPQYFWAILRGEAPLVVAGPLLEEVTADGSGRPPFWRMIPAFVERFRRACQQLQNDSSSDSRRYVAELLLESGIVRACWVTHTPEQNTLPDIAERRGLSIDCLASEIPVGFHGNIADDTLELLDGMSSQQHYHTLFNAHDAVTLSWDTP